MKPTNAIQGWISSSLIETSGNIPIVPYTVDVIISATDDWQSTKLKVKPGQTVVVKYVGGGWYSWCCLGAPDTVSSESGAIVRNAGFSSVIGRIASGQPFFVNLQDPIPASSTGTLFLRINDPDTTDNKGEVRLSIELK